MPSNEQRVAALEAKSAGDQSLRVVIAELGETAAQALERSGIDQSEERVIVVTFR